MVPADDELEQLYREELRQVATSRGGMLYIAAVAMVAFQFADRWIAGSWVPALVATRLGFAAFCVFVARVSPGRSLPQARALLCAVAVAASASIAVVVWNTGLLQSPFFVALVLVPFGVALVLPGDLWVSSSASLSTLAAGLALLLSAHSYLYAANWAAMSGVIAWMTFFLTREEQRRQRQRQGLLREQRQAVRELHASQSRLQAAFEISPDPITIIDLDDLRYVSANPAFCSLTGWSEAEVLGRTPNALGLFDLERAKDALRARVADGSAWRAEGVITTRDGGRREVLNFARPIVLGDRPCLLSFIHDVTEAREAERTRARIQSELEHVHAQLRRVVDNAPLILFALDTNGVFTLSDGKGLERLGVKPGRVVGMKYTEAYAHEPELRAACEQGLKGEPCVTLSRLRTFGQAWQAWWAPVKDAAGVLQSVVGVGFEVTERVAAEESLRESEASFRSLIDRMPDAILVETDGKIVYANQALHELLGFDDERLRTMGILDVIHPDDRAVTAQRMTEILRDARRPPLLERKLLRADGEVVMAEATGLDAVFAGHHSVIAIARDTTERRKMEERLRVSDRMASVGTLAAGVAHEINNPLTYIIANLAYAQELSARLRASAGSSEPLAEFEEVLGEAQEGAGRVRSIVRDLKTFSRPDETRQEEIDVHAVIESSLSMAWNQIRHRARLVRDFGDDIPDVRGNVARLGQVLLNLLVNAAQAIPEGQGDRRNIRVVTRFDAPSAMVRIEVSDDGTGIAPENLQRVFDPFFTTKEFGVGTGLGLSICLGIVRSMGGEISVQSAVGKGSTFTVRIPAARPDQTGAPTPAVSAPVKAAGPAGTVWVVDDDPLVLRALTRQLDGLHHVKGFESARAVLEAIAAGGHFDLMLCDVMMPVMGGMELYEAVRGRAPELAARMVFLTGGAFTPVAAEFIAERRHLEKPLDTDALRAAVQAWLSGAGGP